MYQQLVDLIVLQARELNEELDKKVDIAAGENAALFGKEGMLDSIGLVNLVVAVEQAVEDQFETVLTIADEKAMSQKKSPFRTIGSLAAYVERLIKGEV